MFAYRLGGWVKKGPKYAYVIYEWSLRNQHGDESNIVSLIKNLERDICPKCGVAKAGIIDHLKICNGNRGGKKKAVKRPLPPESQVI